MKNGKEFVLLADENSRGLTDSISKYLTLRNEKFPDENLYSFDFESIKSDNFPDGNIYIQIGGNVRNKFAYLVKAPREPVRGFRKLWMELDALKRSNANGYSIFYTYTWGGRQDHKQDGRVPVTAKAMADIIQVVGGSKLKRYATFQMHGRTHGGFFDIPTDNLTTDALTLYYLRNVMFRDIYEAGPEAVKENLCVGCPDLNSAKESRDFAKMLGDVDMVIVDKDRAKRTDSNLAEGTHNMASVKGVHSGEAAKGKIVLFRDDIGDTCGSVVGAAGAIDYFGPEGYLFLPTHAPFSAAQKSGEEAPVPAEDRLRKAGVKAVITNTVYREPEYFEDNGDVVIGCLDVGPVIGEHIHRNETGMSVSEILKNPASFWEIMDEVGFETVFDSGYRWKK